MMDAGVPGMRNKVAAIKPPEIPPTYMPISMVMALTLSMKNVRGSVNVISMVAVRPGIEPMMIPDATPMKSKSKGSGCSRVVKEVIKCSTKNLFQPGLRQIYVKNFGEEVIIPDNQHDRISKKQWHSFKIAVGQQITDRCHE